LERFPDRRPLDFSRDVFQEIARPGDSPVFGFSAGDGYRYDIGTIDAFVQRQFEVLRGEIPLPGVPWALVRDVEPAASSGAHRGRALIGQGCQMHPQARLRGFNVIGRGVSIGAGASLEDCVILDDTVIADSAKVRQAVVGASCRIGEGVVLGPGTVLGDYSSVGRER
jgi:NDP-sugar pyrophosphorylase family protein